MIFLVSIIFSCTQNSPIQTCENTTLSFSREPIETVGRLQYSPFHNEGPQVAAFDVDQDGQIEVLQCFLEEPLVQYGHNSTKIISHLCGAMAILDWNQDGWLDLVMEVQSNELRRRTHLWWFQNDGGTLTKSHTTHFGLDQIHSLRVGDLNGNGVEDIYASVLAEREEQSDQNVILWGHQNHDIDEELNVEYSTRKTFDSVLADFNLDGMVDIMDANDRGSTFGGNVIWWNSPEGLVPDETCQCLPVQDAMGIDVADVNRDGWLDVITGDLAQNHLLLNDEGNGFYDVSESWGITQMESIEMSWGVRLIDINNDGALDIFSALGDHTYPGMEQAEYEGPLPLSILVQNPTGFTEQASDLGFHETGSFRSIIPIHWNDDGILDYWVTDVEKAPQLWTSDNCTTNNWLNIEAPNHTMIRIKAKGITWTGLVHGQSSYGANRSPHWHVGLGTVTELQSMDVRFPNQDWQTWEDLPRLNQTIVLSPSL